jgi:hypothetical protein
MAYMHQLKQQNIVMAKQIKQLTMQLHTTRLQMLGTPAKSSSEVSPLFTKLKPILKNGH